MPLQKVRLRKKPREKGLNKKSSQVKLSKSQQIILPVKNLKSCQSVNECRKSADLSKTLPPVENPLKEIDSIDSFDSEKCNPLAAYQSDVSLLSVISIRGSWTITDVSKASLLISTPPKPASFNNDQERRNVYMLIYDVLRYRYVLDEALEAISFHEKYPKFLSNQHLVWLMLFDLYHRQFSKHDNEDEERRVELYAQTGILEIDDALWEDRVHLGAAFSRIRIKNNALKLSKLLPNHLSDERVAALANSNSLEQVSAWINGSICKKRNQVQYSLSQLGLQESEMDYVEMLPNQYRFDEFCHQLITYKPEMKAVVSKSCLVKKHHLIVMNRSFCVGPMMFCSILQRHKLRGDVLQTHATTPENSAYLANILTENKRISSLLVFGAGDRKEDYENYFAKLALKNIRVYSEQLVNVPADSKLLENLVAAYVTPPNTYTAVSDPIDLVCTRGGDIALLKLLTAQDYQLKDQLSFILDNQSKTLEYLINNPQVQFAVYETHSSSPAENEDMVNDVIKSVNDDTKSRYSALIQESSGYLDSASDDEFSEISSVQNLDQVECNVNGTQIICNIPLINLFENGDLISNCPDLARSSSSWDDCYLALIKRMEIAQPEILLQKLETATNCSFSMKNKPEVTDEQSNKKKLKKCKRKNIDISRICAPTQASILRASAIRARRCVNCPEHPFSCTRHVHHLEQYKQDYCMKQCTCHTVSSSSSEISLIDINKKRLTEGEREKLLMRLLVPTKMTLRRLANTEKHETISKDELTAISLARRLEFIQYNNNKVNVLNKNVKKLSTVPPSTPNKLRL